MRNRNRQRGKEKGKGREGKRKVKAEEESRDVCCKGEREGQGKRKVEEEKRESSYYKWQSLPGAYDKGLQHCQALKFLSEPLNHCHNAKVSLSPLGDYSSPLKDLFTGSNTAESSNFQDNIRLPSPLLHLNLVHHGCIIHQVPQCGRYLL